MISLLARKGLCALLCLAAGVAACSKDDDTPEGLPPLVWPDDIAAAIPDPVFRAFCVELYDKDDDGRLSKEEVLAVTSISNNGTRRIRSSEGIEFFGNLEKLYLSECDFPSLDLRYNARLERIRLEHPSDLVVFRGPVGYAPLTIELMNPCRNLKEFDLTGCANVRELLISTKSSDDVLLTTIDLPDPSHLQHLTIAASDAACYDALLARGANLKHLYCNYYPNAVLDLSRCPRLQILSVRTCAGSSLSKIRLHREAPLNMRFDVYDEKGRDCLHRIEIEYVE